MQISKLYIHISDDHMKKLYVKLH